MQTREDTDVEDVDLGAVTAAVDGFPVRAAVLYGSVARGAATERSDIDLAVTFDPDLSSSAKTEARLGLTEQLSVVLETDAVDVVPLERAPPSLVTDVIDEGILVYGSASSVTSLRPDSPSDRASEDPLEEFDEVLTDIERAV
ncbi:Nucleotidyltransferase domain-containing protein [Natronoarchaeum philippinense]|uniref:Nucleotidyltransferase domain-containing protein n=1 Tax=Natronoarchaeum philippinense TaxID=558529 RepID=A0A285NR55_NATPI|nr:nucleotidyltransferase domain-containing protein [Natronoarchaeum philippinense]SNZ11678.1 Nucleotidyltransferase domain-containing protein [Natronoarchaeum philippinense]